LNLKCDVLVSKFASNFNLYCYSLGHPGIVFDFNWGSRCAGHCEEDVGRCLCGPGTKFPKRELIGACQPDMYMYEGWTWADKEAHDTQEKIGIGTHRGWREIFGDDIKPPRPLKSGAADVSAVEGSGAGVGAEGAESSAGEGYCNWDMTAEVDVYGDDEKNPDEPSWYKECKPPCRPGWAGPECDKPTPVGLYKLNSVDPHIA
jgi:hypothetical protein